MIDVVSWGMFDENTYVAGDDKECVVIDPGAPAAEIQKLVRGRRVTAILVTHTHLDHIAGADELREATGAMVFVPAGEADGLSNPDVNLSSAFGQPMKLRPAEKTAKGGDVFTAGSLRLVAADAPGHSPGHLVFQGPGFVVTGDTIFAGSIGRTDFPGGDLRTLLASIRRVILSLPDETVIYPGHGPRTTVGTEKRVNPFLK